MATHEEQALEPQGAPTPGASQPAGRHTLKATPQVHGGFDEDMDPAEFSRLLDLYDNSFRNIAEGEVVKGTVLKVTENEVVVDVGYKSEGVIPVNEFLDENGVVTVQAGDVVDVLLERTEDRDGHIVLSREKAEKMKIWDEVEKAFAERKVVIGRVIERIKGGLAVDIGVRAFLPGSQIDVRPVRNLDALRGQELRMRVIKVNKKRGNIVLSRKVLLEEENAEKKKHTLETLSEGKVLTGVVKNITDYGAFIDLGGIDGLLHITDMSWGRVGHPSEVLKVNENIEVVVLKYDQATERVSLGHKQLVADPWTTVMDRYPAGARVSGKAVSLTDYGAFIELEPGVEGLIHVSEMSWSKRVKHPSKILNVGDNGRGHGARRRSRRRGASRSASSRSRAIPGTSWSRSTRSARRSPARCATSPSSARSWKSRTTSTASSTSATCRGASASSTRAKCSRRATRSRRWCSASTPRTSACRSASSSSPPTSGKTSSPGTRSGQSIEGRVVRMTNFGAFVELDEGIEGLIHVSEFDDTQGGEKVDLQVGTAYQMKIIKLSPAERKIGLSIRAMKSDEIRTDWESYSASQGDGSATLGDHFKNK